MFCGGPISWSTIRQSSLKKADIATSSTEAEYNALLPTCREASWFHQLCGQICLRRNAPITIFCDKSTISLAVNENFSKLTCHINLYQHFVKRNVENGIIKVQFLPTSSMIADGLTKALSKVKFKCFVQSINLC